MRELTDLQQKTLDAIRARLPGVSVTGKEIANEIGLKPRSNGKAGADMRAIIHALRVKGYPICASTEGYWWPKSKEELNEYIKSFQARVDDQQSAVDGMIDGLHNFSGPDTLKVKNLNYSVVKNGGRVVMLVNSDKEQDFLKEYPDAEKL